ncbi:hypothetical protein BJ742DRAFT_789054 [Cladochytrium replicatum]|nr:hypothetical protein BJ742DRAFT_789054 [Cladochytrium replicatum]
MAALRMGSTLVAGRLAFPTVSAPLFQTRGYRKHYLDAPVRDPLAPKAFPNAGESFGRLFTHSKGRSIVCSSNPAGAYSGLQRVLEESKVRAVVRYQERFEKPSEKRRRKKREMWWRTYMRFVKEQVQVAQDLKLRTKIAKQTYDNI